ncbi:DUF397 domain-containing protein [Streptomyces polyrhachis]|uniref:DUF397 domain-containing protein n=1 Tax=Streptomyces polyrhachis TaxID=1282885 RepID=A0ABW2GKL5_9ACTN
MRIGNDVPAGELRGAVWRKSGRSNANGDCVEMAGLPGGGAAIRNSRDPEGAALVYTRSEIAAFILGVKDGDFDDLVGG